jgi:hypothetical protein
MTDEQVKKELEKLFSEWNILPTLEKLYQGFEKYQGCFHDVESRSETVYPWPFSPKGDEMESIKKLLVGKTIASVDFSNYKATSDTMVLKFTDGTNIKIVSDPNCTFDGLSFYVQKKRTIEQEYDEEIK